MLEESICKIVLKVIDTWLWHLFTAYIDFTRYIYANKEKVNYPTQNCMNQDL